MGTRDWDSTRPATSKVRKLTEVEKSYIGASIDGEGSLGYYIWKGKGSLSSIQGVLEITFTNTELELISAILRITGVGTVEMKSPNKLSTKPCWQWKCRRRNEVFDLLDQIAPYSIKAQHIISGSF